MCRWKKGKVQHADPEVVAELHEAKQDLEAARAFTPQVRREVQSIRAQRGEIGFGPQLAAIFTTRQPKEHRP